jgi:hypothetical protein
VADEELAPEGGEALELAPENEGTEPETNDDPIASLASELGWVPQDQFRGDPEKWKPAADFIKTGRDIQQTTAKELRTLREQMERVSGVTSQIVQDKIAERDAYWRSQFTQAVEEGDTERAQKLVEQRPTAQPDNSMPAETQAWVAKNEWFNKDPLAQARAIEICERLKHLPVSEQLAQAERGIRKEFPEHFPAPAKQPPGVQTGQARNPAPSNRAKGFADMPADSQKLALDYEKRLGVKREDFAKSYWNERKVG